MKDLCFGNVLRLFADFSYDIPIMYSQAMVNRDLRKKKLWQNKKFQGFGWEEYIWANNFRIMLVKLKALWSLKKSNNLKLSKSVRSKVWKGFRRRKNILKL